MPAYRNNECVRLSDDTYGTIVCTLDYQRDDIDYNDVGAVILLYPDFRQAGDDGLREVSIKDFGKQYNA